MDNDLILGSTLSNKANRFFPFNNFYVFLLSIFIFLLGSVFCLVCLSQTMHQGRYGNSSGKGKGGPGIWFENLTSCCKDYIVHSTFFYCVLINILMMISQIIGISEGCDQNGDRVSENYKNAIFAV